MNERQMRLRPSIHYTPVRDGVYFAGRGDGFVLHGPPTLARIADHVVARLDDGTTETDLLGAVPDGAPRKVVARILDELRQRDMLLDLDLLSVQAPPADDLTAYGDSIAYLEAMSDDPYAAFLRVRSAEVAVRGDTEAAGATRTALARLGAQVVTEVTAATAVLVDVTTDPTIEALAATAGRALDDGRPLVHCLVTDGGVVVAGPRTRPEQPLLADAVRRAAERRRAGLSAPRLADPPNPVLSAFGGNLSAHRAFRWLAGLRDFDDRVVHVDGETLDVTEHLVVGADATASEPADGDYDAFLERAELLYDDAFGVFGVPSPFGLVQSPVFATSIRLATGGEVYGFGLTEAQSRYRALVEALRAGAAGRENEMVAVGLTAASMTVDGVARSLLRAWMRRGCRDGEPIEFTAVGDELARLCWKTLALRHGRDIAVRWWRPVRAPIWLAAVHEAGTLRCAGYGTTPDVALRDTLVTALGATQAATGTGHVVAGWLDTPVLAEATDDEPSVEEVLAAVGAPFPVTPLAHPAATAVGIALGRVRERA